MCGIVGYIGAKSTPAVLVAGLRKLEYRGYDSAGIAVVENGVLQRRRANGKLANLEEKLRAEPVGNGPSGYGIGHTRWATHGRPSEENAHPHVDCSGKLVVVHNGIIENYPALKKELAAAGHTFVTETDTEVIAHLIEAELNEPGGPITAESFEKAFRAAVAQLEGIYALGALHSEVPDLILGARQGPPLVVGYGEGEYFLASDVPAVLNHTRLFAWLEDGETVRLSKAGATLFDRDGNIINRAPQRVNWDPVQAEKAGYRHFMLKEIHEQPRAVKDTLAGRLTAAGGVNLAELELTDAEVKAFTRIQILACGTSLHAGWVGKFLFENLAGIATECDYGSEFRYRGTVMPKGTLAVAISQSGETADTLAAMKEAKNLGALPLAICNVVGSAIPREARATLYTHAGPEIGVASTKAFTTQLIALTLLAADLGVRRGFLKAEALAELHRELTLLPHKLETVLKLEPKLVPIARKFHTRPSFLFLGRGVNYPTALEGALKLKEISYLHAEGYPAGEMKHGPIALIDDGFPVVAVCLKDKVYEKMLGNVEEVKARDGAVIALVTEGDTAIAAKADAILALPPVHPLLSPILAVVPLQMLAYEIALLRGADVDQPRNLAKSVTVE